MRRSAPGSDDPRSSLWPQAAVGSPETYPARVLRGEGSQAGNTMTMINYEHSFHMVWLAASVCGGQLTGIHHSSRDAGTAAK